MIMDIIKWLEPSINSSVDDVTALCDKEREEVDKEFRELCNLVVCRYPDVAGDMIELSDLYFDRRGIVSKSYRSGFFDGLTISNINTPKRTD